MIVETIRTILLGDLAVTGIVSDRIYPVEIPDEPLFPLLIITKASGAGEYTLEGDAGIEMARVQIDCYSDAGQSECIALKAAVRARLSGYSGGPDSSQCIVDSIMVIQDMDMPATGFERAGPSRLRRRLLEFNVWNRGL